MTRVIVSKGDLTITANVDISGGGGGRIAIYYQDSFMQNAGSSTTVEGGQPASKFVNSPTVNSTIYY